jgi:hypothetical protein
MTPTAPARFFRNRIAVIAAATIGFTVGAAGFAVAKNGADDPVAAPSTTVDDAPSTTDDAPTTTVDEEPTITIDDAPSTTLERPGTTIDLTIPAPSITIDDSTSTTIADGPSTTIDDGPSTTVDDSPSTTIDDGPSTTIDDSPSTSIDDGPSTTIDDSPSTTIDDGPSTTVSSLPAPFTQTYSSSGGSISVTWTGSSFSLGAVSPAAGYSAEIEDQAWDRIRVDFEGPDDHRVEVRIDDGQLRVRVD